MKFEELKPGDMVGTCDRYRASILAVTKRTKAQVVLSDGSRWMVRTGRKVGSDTWSFSGLCTVEDAKERIAQLREERAVNDAAHRLRDFKWRELTSVQLARFTALLDEVIGLPSGGEQGEESARG